ncbi:Lipase maturation factor 1 [Symbiodinium microadriaticum]|uniref:Lipase maturation factor 1 n=1 Tax=Symbiodinium microadriaticum TaxID=2951 RepID=A0A1Q9EW27_SYMMI|nr:Lipase maturation factor 1 [Symbiodinium microadriaticum]CAE7331486.1 Lmf1 [Symbiodinium microadriaticum]
MLVRAPVQPGTLSVVGAQRPSPPRVHAFAGRPSCRSMSEGARLPEPGNLKPAVLGCLACVIADVRGLWLEIWSFAKRSAAACESGRTPWIQAAFTGLATGTLAAVVAVAAASRPVAAPLAGSYWLTRVLSLRWLSAIFFIAFLVALRQNKALIGDDGILPARQLLRRVDVSVARTAGNWRELSFRGKVRCFVLRAERLPTLLWFAGARPLNSWLDGLAWAGLLLSGTAFAVGGASVLHLFTLWILYISLVAVGQRWYSFGWESQLLETTLLQALAAPALAGGAMAASPSMLAPWAFRWLAFRIMLGAGLIKARGSKTWLDLTAMCHHIETQPIPNPLSRRFHNLPRRLHLYATASNHIIELVMPWLLLFPCRPALAAFGAVHILFQLTLILTGNLSFLNWLTIIPGLWCFDDATLVGLLPEAVAQPLVKRVLHARAVAIPLSGITWHFTRDISAAGIIAWLSLPVWRNLLGPRGGGRQRMNSTFERRVVLPRFLLRLGGRGEAADETSETSQSSSPAQKRRRLLPELEISMNLQSLRLLNTYGAFGSVNTERIEIVFEGTPDGRNWYPYTFKAAVDDPMKRPGFLAPYHLRLDWCRWIASCRGRRSNGLAEPWVLSFVAHLLRGDPATRKLLAKGGDPFERADPPLRVRGELYQYVFAPQPRSRADPYWLRERVGKYLPPLGLDEVSNRLADHGLL